MSTLKATSRPMGALALATMGVVYGDIGTSPLYAFKEVFAHGLPATQYNILATLSALFWAITIIISIKYIWLVLRFDNKGEGGVLALQALALRHSRRVIPKWSSTIALLGIFAAALFYGDAILTPAISVLAAVEGIRVIAPQFEYGVLPVTAIIILGLFLIQKWGASKVGVLFGPIMLLWFTTLGILGVNSIVQHPQVLAALNPWYALEFTIHHPTAAFFLLSAIFLALTGGEALYADMGHFGAKPIRIAWYGVVCPALILNYFGQGALMINDSQIAENPFYFLAPDFLLVPLVILATCATVIASQATISGAYSLTLQAINLGYLPRIRISHTSDTVRGQIYISSLNGVMLLAVLILVASFGSSSALASAYGVAVSGTMLITSFLVIIVAYTRPNQRLRRVITSFILISSIFEVLFLLSNLTKIANGGWLPLVLGALIFTLLSTWKKGSVIVAEQRKRINMTIRRFIDEVYPSAGRIAGTAIYLNSSNSLVPSRLFHNLKHYKVLHENIVFLHVNIEEIPYVSIENRLAIIELASGIYTVNVHFGFREEPNLRTALQLATIQQVPIDHRSSYFVARTTIVKCAGILPYWQCALFSVMMRQSESAATYFHLPASQVVEIGTQITV
jgi:KUP system potassium uptake protein